MQGVAGATQIVLILVLMEDTLRVLSYSFAVCAANCLNPCFNGRYSQSFSVTGYICKDAES